MEDFNEFLSGFEDLESEMPEVTLDDEKDVELSEDLTGFAAGFPDWDLLPPKKKKA